MEGPHGLPGMARGLGRAGARPSRGGERGRKGRGASAGRHRDGPWRRRELRAASARKPERNRPEPHTRHAPPPTVPKPRDLYCAGRSAPPRRAALFARDGSSTGGRKLPYYNFLLSAFHYLGKPRRQEGAGAGWAGQPTGKTGRQGGRPHQWRPPRRHTEKHEEDFGAVRGLDHEEILSGKNVGRGSAPRRPPPRERGPDRRGENGRESGATPRRGPRDGGSTERTGPPCGGAFRSWPPPRWRNG